MTLDSDSSQTYTSVQPEAAEPASRGSQFSTQASEVNCSGSPRRFIISELQALVQFCVIYGQNNDPDNGSWVRTIWSTWEYYTGWNSAQSKIQTAPAAGTPTLKGTISSRKQNGILPPTVLATSLWTAVGNANTWGWVVGGLNTGGTFSLAINDLEVTDPAKNFNFYIGAEVAGQRFMCDTEEERCYYPNQQEAPIL